MTSLSTLNAPEGTPLERRLRDQDRLRDHVDDVFTATNVVPLQMSPEELRAGTHWLMNALFAPEAFLDRLAVAAGQLPTAPRSSRTFLDDGREGARLWDRLQHAFRVLGPEFESLPRRGAELFRGRDLTHLGTALIFHLHVVRLLRHWGIWDPALAARSAPAW